MSAALTQSNKRQHEGTDLESGRGKLQKTGGVNSTSQSSKSTSGGLVFRLLCPVTKIGGVLGKGGAMVSQIRDESGAKIRVEDPIPGFDERVIVIAGVDKESEEKSEQVKEAGSEEGNVAEEGGGEKCGDGETDSKGVVSGEESKSVNESSIQKALLLVFERMMNVEPETKEGDEAHDKNSSALHLRLLVYSNQVGRLLGKGGSIIKHMSSESKAQIRFLPKDRLPVCATTGDEVLQLIGEVDAVRKALQLVSQQLLEYSPKDHSSHHAKSATHSSGRSRARPEAYPLPDRPFHSQAPFAPGARAFHEHGIRGPLNPSVEVLTFRLLCHADRAGGVVGKGGAVVKTIQQETACEISVIEVPDSEDRLIVISGPVHPDDRISPAQEAVLRVQSKIFKDGKENNVLARLLVYSKQIGCLLGKGGSVMAEMRNSTGAYIRILGKDQNPKCASENEELIQVTGNFEAVQDALLQITTRLRNHFFRDLFPSIDYPVFPDQMPPFLPYMGRREFSPPFHPFHDFDGIGPPPPLGFHPHDDPLMHGMNRRGMPPHMSARRHWGPQGLMEGGAHMEDFEGPPPHRRHPGFGGMRHQAIITSTTIEVVVPRSVVPAIYGEDGLCLKQIREISDARIKITDPEPGASETVIIISGTPEQSHAAQSLIQAFVMSEQQPT